MNIAEANDAFSLQFALVHGHAVAWHGNCNAKWVIIPVVVWKN